MCGIAASLFGVDASVPPRGGGRLREALRGRGPDTIDDRRGPGFHVWASRLALWDEGSAEQPFVAPGAVGVFNGELYNLPELQARLGLPGASEIEVLTRGVLTRGPAFLDAIDGQFAGIAIDPADGRAVVFRDRFGIAPLYVRALAGEVLVASDPMVLDGLDAAATATFGAAGLAGVLCDWGVPSPASPWAGVGQVRPGTAAEVRGGVLGEAVSWASEWRPSGPAEASPEADADELLDLLREAVRLRTRSTHEVTVALSGGVDSTIIGALAAREGVRRSFGIVTSLDPVAGERQLEIARAVGLEHRHVEITPDDLLEGFFDFVDTRRTPLVRLGPVGMTLLARFVHSRGIRCVLSGEGADELFCGYDSARVQAARAGVFGDPARLPWGEFGSAEMTGGGPAWHAAYWRTQVASDSGPLGRHHVITPLLGFLRPAVLEAVEARRAEAEAANGAAKASGASGIETRRRDDLRHLLDSYLLTVQGDHAWMPESVEQRPPYLSAPVAHWALTRPAERMVSLSQGKLPVRTVLARLAREVPAMAGFDFDKSAFRLDAALIMRSETAADGLAAAVRACPDDILDVAAVSARLDACRRAGRVSEAESMLLLFAASLGRLTS